MAKRKRDSKNDDPEKKPEQDKAHEKAEDKQHVAGAQEQDEEKEQSFEELGLDYRLIHALSKKSIEKPTPIQRAAIPRILEGKDVVARAKTGSGKTLAYMLPLLQKLFADSPSKKKRAPSAFILVPTQELCHQIDTETRSMVELCRVQLKVVKLTSTMPASELKTSLAGLPEIVVSTPACVQRCLTKGILQADALQESLSVLILDEADSLLSYGYEDDLKALIAHVPTRCQCLLMSATTTPSADVEKLKKLVLHNPYILTLPEVEDDIIPKNVEQFYIWCSARDSDRLVHILALLKLGRIQKKVLVFTNSTEMSFRLKLFLEQFGIKSTVLNAELPQNSRQHIIMEFNAGIFDYLIATDDRKMTEEENDKESRIHKKSRRHSKKKFDAEFGVGRGIDFKNVYTVINFEMPQTAAGYIHRIGRTGRAYNFGESISLVAPGDMEIFKEIKSLLGDNESEDLKVLAPFTRLTKDAVDSLRYRAEDVARSITKIAVREARAQDLRNELLNSEKLKAHFQHNQKELELLKHDKVLSKKPPASHLSVLPNYIVDPTKQEASKIVINARSAKGNANSDRRKGSKGKLKKSRDPLKTFSAAVPKPADKAGMVRKGKGKYYGNK